MVWLRRILKEYGKISNKNGLKEKIHLYINKSIKEGDSVKFTITLLDSTHPEYFYKMNVADKLDHIKRLKETAARFFKSSLSNKYKKAADLY